ncbi:hypothetical protein Q9G86_27040 [Bacillus thuringiensis]|nr:hypothetical protein [Bacillus thuringiensis]WLP64227.1 hypothetical protein Q9G86_27040 [Bacillus thuringiensis]
MLITTEVAELLRELFVTTEKKMLGVLWDRRISISKGTNYGGAWKRNF